MFEISQELQSFNDQGLILQLFELGKLFVDKRIVTFHAHGICMYPCIQKGDMLHVESRLLQQIRIGDIAVYRRNNHLFAHRVIDKLYDNLDYLITRSDNARSGIGEKVADNDILGIVSKIERNGKLLSPQRKAYPFLVECMYAARFLWQRLNQSLFRKAVSVICCLQRSKIYQKIARILFAPLIKRISFSVQVPLNSKIDRRFYRLIAPQELSSLEQEIQQGRVSGLRIVAAVNNKAVARLEYIFTPQGRSSFKQWTPEAYTKIRYRHTGIEERLLAYANGILKQIYSAT